MNRVLIIILFASSTLLGCRPPDSTSPEGAFATLAKCIDNADASCLYAGLNRESRWSVQTIHRILSEMRGIVEIQYPAHLRSSAYGTWSKEAAAKDQQGLFDAYCKKRNCLKKIARGFGAVVSVKQLGPDLVEIETTRGHQFKMAQADGKWGLAIFQDDLQQAKISLSDRIKQVKKNAVAFEEQRQAGASKTVLAHEKEKKHDR